MEVKHLGDTDFKVIMECFLSAFENYFVQMPTDHNYYRQRWKAARVKYDLSYGMFDNDRLVGFIINAIDHRHGNLTSYNTGTGVIPEYRGQRIVKSIYEYAIPELRKNGITKCLLEVITENEKAIKSYTGIRFSIIRTLKCFSSELEKLDNNLIIEEKKFEEINWEGLPNQKYYSWDFHRHSLEKSNSQYYYVYNNGSKESFFALNPENGTINQFEILVNNSQAWDNLIQAIASKTQKVRTINVDSRLEDKLSILKKYNFTNTVNQFEMELSL